MVSDTQMPGCCGRQLLAVARGMPVPPLFVLMSGEPDVYESKADIMLYKPFPVTHLLTLVTELMRCKSRASTQPLQAVRYAAAS